MHSLVGNHFRQKFMQKIGITKKPCRAWHLESPLYSSSSAGALINLWATLQTRSLLLSRRQHFICTQISCPFLQLMSCVPQEYPWKQVKLMKQTEKGAGGRFWGWAMLQTQQSFENELPWRICCAGWFAHGYLRMDGAPKIIGQLKLGKKAHWSSQETSAGRKSSKLGWWYGSSWVFMFSFQFWFQEPPFKFFFEKKANEWRGQITFFRASLDPVQCLGVFKV